MIAWGHYINYFSWGDWSNTLVYGDSTVKKRTVHKKQFSIGKMILMQVPLLVWGICMGFVREMSNPRSRLRPIVLRGIFSVLQKKRERYMHKQKRRSYGQEVKANYSIKSQNSIS